MLKLNDIQINVAKTIARNIKKLDLASNHQPASVAASSIMLMATIFKLNISKKMISDVYKISQVTIIKAYRIIFNWRKILICNESTDKFLEISRSKILEENNSDKFEQVDKNDYIDTESDIEQINKNDYSDTEDNNEDDTEQINKINIEKEKKNNLINRYI